MGSFQDDVADTNDGSLRIPKPGPLSMDSMQVYSCLSEGKQVHADDLLAVQVETEQASHHIPPNGGLGAWLQVAGSFFLFSNSWYVPVLK